MLVLNVVGRVAVMRRQIFLFQSYHRIERALFSLLMFFFSSMCETGNIFSFFAGGYFLCLHNKT